MTAGERTAAALTIRQHDEPPSQARPYSGRCRQCQPQGCPLERWARTLLAGQRIPYPPVEPVLLAG